MLIVGIDLFFKKNLKIFKVPYSIDNPQPLGPDFRSRVFLFLHL